MNGASRAGEGEGEMTDSSFDETPSLGRVKRTVLDL